VRLLPDGRDLDREARGGVTRKLLIVLVTAAAAAAAIVANIVLLGSAAASSDPVGHLSPRAHLPAAPHGTVRPTAGRPHDEHADD
jgi:hypothetical protein